MSDETITQFTTAVTAGDASTLDALLTTHPALRAQLDRPHFADPQLEALIRRGREHEARYVESLRSAGREIVDLTDLKNDALAVERTFEAMRAGMRGLDEKVVELRTEFSAADQRIRGARQLLEGVRADVMKAELAKTTASSDLTHLAELCLETIGASIDQVVEEVARMEDAGELASPSRRLAAAAMPDDGDEYEADPASDSAAQPESEVRLTTPEDVITDLKKKIAIGAVSRRELQADRPEDVAAEIRKALKYIPADRLVVSSDCGFGRQGCNREIAFYKASAIAQGCNIVRRELGLDTSRVPAQDPGLQVDIIPKAATR